MGAYVTVDSNGTYGQLFAQKVDDMSHWNPLGRMSTFSAKKLMMRPTGIRRMVNFIRKKWMMRPTGIHWTYGPLFPEKVMIRPTGIRRMVNFFQKKWMIRPTGIHWDVWSTVSGKS